MIEQGLLGFYAAETGIFAKLGQGIEHLTEAFLVAAQGRDGDGKPRRGAFVAADGRADFEARA